METKRVFRQKIVCAMAQKQKQPSMIREQQGWLENGVRRHARKRTGKADRRQNVENLHTRWGPLDVITIDPHDKPLIDPVIIIYTFDICKLSYFLKFICNTQNNTCRTFSVTHRPAEQQIFLCTFSRWGETKEVFFWFQLSYYKQCPFCYLFRVTFFMFCALY